VGDIYSLPLNAYTDLLRELDLMDQATFNTADGDRMFITGNANGRGPLIPANALVRF